MIKKITQFLVELFFAVLFLVGLFALYVMSPP